jgi:hypothetical protein
MESNEGAEMHVVFATDASGKTHRVSDNLTWGQAQSAWKRLDDCRLAGLMPHVKFFEVRSNADQQPRFRDAKVNMTLLRVVLAKTRGHKTLEAAGRAALRHNFGDRFHQRGHNSRYGYTGDAAGERTGVQGRGGWFYYPNGAVLAQGLTHLGKVMLQRNMVVQGVNGRWYVLDGDLDTDDLLLSAVSSRAA